MKYGSLTDAAPEGIVVTGFKHGGGYVVVEGRAASMRQAMAYLRVLSDSGWAASLDRLEKSKSGGLAYDFSIYMKRSG